ncbi:MAG: hypothetical protein HY525_12120 [Betaproteobacteria bacterium]|nr:hypothetical protein [Betaproteobacteria bacterium]
MATEPKKAIGPRPEHLKLAGNWEKFVGDALKKQRPESGWPNTKGKKKAAKK